MDVNNFEISPENQTEKMITIMVTFNGRENPLIVPESVRDRFREIGYQEALKDPANKNLKLEDFKYGNYLNKMITVHGFSQDIMQKAVMNHEVQ